MKKTLVREWMTPDPVVISSKTTLPDAGQLMTERRIRRLPVVEAGRVVGIITESGNCSGIHARRAVPGAGNEPPRTAA